MNDRKNIEERRAQFYETLPLLDKKEFIMAMTMSEKQFFFPLINGLIDHI